MRKPKTLLLCLVLLIGGLGGITVMAQSDDDQPVSDTALFSPDEVLEGYLAVSNPINTELRLSQNPTKAIFKSMLVPGWGQVGNHKYIKAGVYASLQGFWVVLALDYRSQANDYYDKYKRADSLSTKNEFYSLYEDKRNKRNRYLWFVGLTTFISMFDAYVDAHMSGFPIVEKLQPLELSVGPTRQYDLGAAISYRF